MIYVKCSNAYKKKFADGQHVRILFSIFIYFIFIFNIFQELCKRLHEKTSNYADLLVKQPVTLALIGEGGVRHPSATVSNTSPREPSTSTLLSSTTSSSSHGSYPIPEGEVLSTNRTSTASRPVKANTGDKRRADSTNDLPSEKRQKKEKL